MAIQLPNCAGVPATAAFIDALTATNFIAVLDLDLDKADTFADLREGFYYGDEHVVRATLKLEFVLLRAWRASDR